MEFGDPPRPARSETVLPMINLVFLLLIFFLMVATLAPPETADIETPQAEAVSPLDAGGARLAMTGDGTLVYGATRGPAALSAFLARGPGEAGEAIRLHADRAAPAQAVAVLLRDLAERGAGPVWLITDRAP